MKVKQTVLVEQEVLFEGAAYEPVHAKLEENRMQNDEHLVVTREARPIETDEQTVNAFVINGTIKNKITTERPFLVGI